MKRLVTAAALAVLMATPALAQSTPNNNGLSQLNSRGTYGSAPSFGGPTGPVDCIPGDPRPGCQQQAAVPEDQPQRERAMPGDMPNNPNPNPNWNPPAPPPGPVQ